MQQFKTLFVMLLRNFFRDPQSLFFSLAFPVLFLLIFGFVYMGGGEGTISPPTLGLYMSEIEDREYLEEVLKEYEEYLLIESLSSPLEVEERVRSNDVHFGLLFIEKELIFYYNPTHIQSNQYYQQLASTILADVNSAKTGVREFVTTRREAVIVREGISQLDYMLPGVIALGILSTAIFTITGSFMHFREKGVLKRMAATPIKKALFLISLMFTRFMVVILSSLIIIIVGRLVFGLTPLIDWPFFLLFLFISTLAMMAFGFFITLFASSAHNASEVASILLTIMIFFSGIYIPLDFLPSYLQRLGRVLPLYYLAEGLRSVMRVEVMPINELIRIMIIMMIGAFLIIFFASKRISWEERI